MLSRIVRLKSSHKRSIKLKSKLHAGCSITDNSVVLDDSSSVLFCIVMRKSESVANVIIVRCHMNF